MVSSFTIKQFTLCFCKKGQNVLLLKRKKDPNKNLWNGLGGKLEHLETPFQALCREVLEEANIDLLKTGATRYAGIVAGYKKDRSALYIIHTYITEIPVDWNCGVFPRDTREGKLEWHTIDWVCNRENTVIVCDIPDFLPLMLESTSHNLYHFKNEGTIYRLEVVALSLQKERP